MTKHVVVIASGETERKALPQLVAHLRERRIVLRLVITPPGHRDLRPNIAINLIRSVWYGPDSPPDKFVILVDVDGKDPSQVLEPFKRDLPTRLNSDVVSRVQYAYAQWHLEAWYFADATNLRRYLGGRNLGSVDTSQPDNIQNPKLHLKNLLSDVTYTSRVSEEIANVLDAETIAQRSRSFQCFLEAVKNGTSRTESDC